MPSQLLFNSTAHSSASARFGLGALRRAAVREHEARPRPEAAQCRAVQRNPRGAAHVPDQRPRRGTAAAEAAVAQQRKQVRAV